VSGGKDGQIYVLNRDDLGQFSSAQNNVYQQFTLVAGGQNFSTPVYFNGTVYVWPSGTPLKAFAISDAKLATTPTMQSSNSITDGRGAVISVSSNGTSSGIVWALDYGSTTLFAYDATSVTNSIYTSAQAGTRDTFSTVGGHFITPTVVDGKVYFGTGTSVVVFGLLP
jgi:hypothetical protein